MQHNIKETKMAKVSKKTVNLASNLCANHVMLQLIANEIIARTTQENLTEAEKIANLTDNLMKEIESKSDSLNNILEKTNLKDVDMFELCVAMMRDVIKQQYELVTKLVAINNEEV